MCVDHWIVAHIYAHVHTRNTYVCRGVRVQLGERKSISGKKAVPRSAKERQPASQYHWPTEKIVRSRRHRVRLKIIESQTQTAAGVRRNIFGPVPFR